MSSKANHFTANGYRARVERQVPGLNDLHRIVGLLLAETMAESGSVLALGAGGGMELQALREHHPGWTFAAVDPSADMIAQATETLGGDLDRISFTHGYIDDAPAGPFDGATCLLVLHFLEREERLRTLRELRRRLRTGAPLVVVHHSFPTGDEDRWLDRYADFQIARGADAARTRAGIASMKDKLPALSPSEDEALLQRAGFERVALFYAALTFKGWISFAA
ncbi:class I SAM-dependent methyltransferase [Poseidonocella sedimentorum]|uniref:tRNA (Cmo5U34)-methyltransferase n=1 Tax=Poseidonocella sedimentorum TaxID=871652 RepID=A0A1I6CWV2_9RHOB|nr:class I SAM-dependent methyltransferase [Poseidonocella sedimentorum]SFQ97557.1 tRNA (cmo5U34)-methyltransferase [Poseidonocella sedimentorum]